MKPSSSRKRRIAVTILARVMKTSRVSALDIRSSSRWRRRVSVSVSPWCFSGGGRSDFASSVQPSTATESSPRRVLKIVPSAPSRSPRSQREQRARTTSSPSTSRARLELDPAAAVVEIQERHLALAAARVQAAGDAHARRRSPRRVRVLRGAPSRPRSASRPGRRAGTGRSPPPAGLRACGGGRRGARRTPRIRHSMRLRSW